MICRALAGRNARNRRAVVDRAEKGLKLVVTSVRNRVIIFYWEGCDPSWFRGLSDAAQGAFSSRIACPSRLRGNPTSLRSLKLYDDRSAQEIHLYNDGPAMTSVSLTTRLTSLKEARNTTHTLIARLSKLPRQPGSDNSEVRVELSAEIHQLLKEQEEELELLRQDLDDFSVGRDKEKEAEKARLEVGVQRLGEDLRLCIPSSPLLSLVGLRLTQHHDDRYRARTHYRKAQLQAKRNAELARQKERELLFAGAPQDGESHGQGGRSRKQRGGPVSQDEQLVNASGDVTAALRQTHQLMQSELSRSQFAHDTLSPYLSLDPSICSFRDGRVLADMHTHHRAINRGPADAFRILFQSLHPT